MDIHQVTQGESIREIAQIYGVTQETIIEINGLTQPENLVTGMQLVIPTDNPAPLNILGSTHIVQPSETLWSISRMYSMPLSRLVKINNISIPYVVNPSQKVKVLVSNGPAIETLGYIYPGISADPAALVQQIGPNLTYLGLFEFPITPTGNINGTVNEGVLTAAQNVNAAALPVLTNLDEQGFNPDIAHEALTNTANRQNLITNALALLNQHNLVGIIIDFEKLYPTDRNLFTQFIQELSVALHNESKLLIVNIIAKWEDAPTAPWAGFFDYNALGPLVDRAAIMTYEWTYISGPPGPTAPIANVRKVLDYAVANNIPANKILMGMTLYGYDWEVPDTPENLATTVTLPAVWDLGRKYNSIITFDETAGQPSMSYTNEQGQNHIIWFEDAKSHYLKYQLVIEYGLKGVFYWIINQPFPATYYMVSHLFQVVKL